MNILKLALPLAAVATITACDGLKDALTAHTDVAARAERNELSVTRLSDLMGNTPLQITANREVAGIITDLWVHYQLLGIAAARGDSLGDPKLIDDATLGAASSARLRKFMEKVSADFNVDSATETAYNQAAGNIFHARHILFKFPEGGVPGAPSAPSQAQKDSVRRVAEGVRARTTNANFADLAKRYGSDGTKDQGGDLGAFPRDQMVKPFSDAVAALRPGEIGPLVETQFGYHIVQRTPWSLARRAFNEAFTGTARQRAESTFMARVDSGAKIEVRSSAGATAKNAARELGSHRQDGDVLASYRGGQLTVGRFVMWIESYPPQARLVQQLAQADDTTAKSFIRAVARQEVLLRMADSAGVTIDSTERTASHATFKQVVMSLWQQLGLDPRSLADSGKSAPERERIAAARVESYLDRVMQGQAQPLNVPVPIQHVLMAKYEEKIHPAGIDRAVERAKKIRVTADSARAAQQPRSQVPLPMPPAQGGGARPDSGKRP